MGSELCCPCPSRSALVINDGRINCSQPSCMYASHAAGFTKVREIPVLIAFQRVDTVCRAERYSNTEQYFYIPRSHRALTTRIKRLVTGGGECSAKNCAAFVARLKKGSAGPRVLIVGSGSAGNGTELLWKDPDIVRVGIDIYPSATVNYIADAHFLPFADDTFDGVWIQAVLEHVVEPSGVVAEIYRILKEGGIVYSETPFMQQVHEGAYDFTRYTVLGHRFLFRRFREIDLGPLLGPGLAFAWSAKYLAWAIFRHRGFASAITAPLYLAGRIVDSLLPARARWDGASGTYFLGERSNQGQLSAGELLCVYNGLQKVVDER